MVELPTQRALRKLEMLSPWLDASAARLQRPQGLPSDGIQQLQTARLLIVLAPPLGGLPRPRNARIPNTSHTFQRLCEYIAKRMRMSHSYQPLMLMELFGRRSPASSQDVAPRILGEDMTQIEHDSERVKRM
jgi:hypothetical protein